MEKMDLAVLIPVIVSALTAYITSLITVRNDIRKQQKELYLEFFCVFEPLLNNKELVFDKVFIDKLLVQKAKIKLIASNATIGEYRKLFDKCTGLYTGFCRFCEENNPIEKYTDEEGNYRGTGYEIEDYNERCTVYCVEKLQEVDFSALMIRVTEEMRNDIGHIDMPRIKRKTHEVIVCVKQWCYQIVKRIQLLKDEGSNRAK